MVQIKIVRVNGECAVGSIRWRCCSRPLDCSRGMDGLGGRTGHDRGAGGRSVEARVGGCKHMTEHLVIGERLGRVACEVRWSCGRVSNRRSEQR